MGSSDGRHWVSEPAEAVCPNLVSAKVDFAGLADFANTLLIDEPKAEVQVSSRTCLKSKLRRLRLQNQRLLRAPLWHLAAKAPS